MVLKLTDRHQRLEYRSLQTHYTIAQDEKNKFLLKKISICL